MGSRILRNKKCTKTRTRKGSRLFDSGLVVYWYQHQSRVGRHARPHEQIEPFRKRLESIVHVQNLISNAMS